MYVDCNQNDPEQNMCILFWVPLICSPSRSWFWPQTKVNQTSIDPAKTGNIFWCFCYARKLLMLPAPSWQPGGGSKFERPRWTRKWGILNVFFFLLWVEFKVIFKRFLELVWHFVLKLSWSAPAHCLTLGRLGMCAIYVQRMPHWLQMSKWYYLLWMHMYIVNNNIYKIIWYILYII